MCLLGVSQAWSDNRYVYFDNPSIVLPNNDVTTDQNGVMTYPGQQIHIWWDGGLLWGDENRNHDYTWTATAYGNLEIVGNTTLQQDNNTKNYPVSFKAKEGTEGGGSIVVVAQGHGDNSTSAPGFRGFYVITVPYPGNHIWNFEDFDHTGSIHPQDGSVTPNQNALWVKDYKSKPSSGENQHPIMVANPHQSDQDGYNNILGTNAYYIQETAGLLFYTNTNSFGYNGTNPNGNKKYVTWGGRSPYDNSGYNPTFKIPQVQGGKYIKVWWDGMSEGGLGANFQVENLLDLEGVEIQNEFNVTGVVWNTTGTQYLGGVVIFKVKGASSERKDVVFKLKDTGWNDIYRIEVTDVYSTDMILKQQVGYDWPNYKEVLYTNYEGNIVMAPNEMNVEHKREMELVAGAEVTAWPIKSYMGDGNSLIERAKTCDWDVVQEPNNIVEWEKREWISSRGVHYWNLDITKVKGTGNIKIIQKVKYGNSNYVLDKKETWIAIGTYKQQSYPYTWDFTDYNVSQGSLYAWLSGSNTYGTQKYGHWKMENSETYALETHEQVNGTILNGQTNQYEKVDKPLFAQGAQLTYWKQDNTIGIIKEAEGLRVKQAWGTKGELAVGEDFDGELSIDGKSLKYTPAGKWSRLHITIPNVDAGMYVFIKADDGTEAENYANPNVKSGNTELTVDNSYNTKNKVRAYKVTTTGDVDITFSNAARIKAIGVTNIFKSINALGYATESRDVDIDHIYEGEFTKNDVNAYCIQTYNDEGFTYEYKGTPIVKKSQVMNVIPKNTGIVLYKEGHSGDAFNVPLFYPACNAKVKEAEQIALDNNWMAPWVTEGAHDSETIGKNYAMHKFDEDGESYNTDEKRGEICTKFVMSRQYYIYNKTYNSDSEEKTSEQEAFYRMRLKTGGNNTMGANKAYLLIPTTKLPLALWDPNSDGEGIPGQAKPGVIFMDDIEALFGGEEPISGIATAIDAIESAETVDNVNTYYTISGVKIQGRPTEKGVYIVNGKKVLVK